MPDYHKIFTTFILRTWALILDTLGKIYFFSFFLLFKDNPSIYSKRLTDYKDSQNKEKLWEEKAADMGVEVAALKTFYVQPYPDEPPKENCGEVG